MGTRIAGWVGLIAVLVAGCARPAPQPTREVIVSDTPPASAAVSASASTSAAPPGAAASAAPTASAAPAASVDRLHCHPHSPAVRFEVEDDDVVRPIDAAGCPLGESHFKFNGYGYQASVDFMAELQKRLAAGDKAGLADLASFPLRVNRGKAALIVKDRAAFLRQFGQIYSPAVVEVIRKQDPRDVFCNYQGIMLGNGIVWADNEHGGRLGVISINPP